MEDGDGFVWKLLIAAELEKAHDADTLELVYKILIADDLS